MENMWEAWQAALAARQPAGQEPVVVRVPRHEASPYFECTPEQWDQHTHGMTPAGKNMLANMLAHHLLLARRDELGWIVTRDDLIAEGRPWWHVSNNGKLTYDYDPATKERKVSVPPAQAVDLGKFLPAVRMLVVSARTSGGTAGRDAHLCEALDRVEALLPPIDSQVVGK
ncbi:hypothetical protein CEK00_04900 [Stenotrophomonas maltophilia]|uniref:Uncharacterized protein n=2 Tax=Stenotrophomonas maltophilia TaxID=40324 RepID=A0A270NM52_STEMA|nr:hypothetical protein CEK00_04900 [Stenotrophomonas maltophilia]